MARHTFRTYTATKGVPIETIGQMEQHPIPVKIILKKSELFGLAKY